MRWYSIYVKTSMGQGNFNVSSDASDAHILNLKQELKKTGLEKAKQGVADATICAHLL